MSAAAAAQRCDTAPPLPFHHSSHRHLLHTVDATPGGSAVVDAIIVPTVRRPANLRPAIDLAAHLGCTLVTLCSRYCSATEVARFAEDRGIELIAIDIAKLPVGLLPSFRTTQMLAGTVFEQKSDLSLKRNLGLLLARLMGWQRIVFLDDDIWIPRPEDLPDAVRLLDSYAAVGLYIGGFPDNSVVCHAYRQIGGPQDTFIGGGALAVGPAMMTSFFPNIYNEDWFFLLDNVKLRSITATGRVVQQPYDPFADDKRARSEEFGDALAEGVFWLLDHGRRVKDANVEHWQRFLVNRLAFIETVLDGARRLDMAPTEKDRMIAALKAARGRCQLVSPELCVEYLRAWRADCTRWQRHVEQMHHEYVIERRLPRQKGRPDLLNPEKLLPELGLAVQSRYLGPARRLTST